MQWFRLWTDAVDDEKLRLLAFEDRWHFVALLCLKAKGLLDTPTTPELLGRKVGVKLGLTEPAREEVKRRLLEVELIDANWQPIGWDHRQFQSDHTAAERKRKQRAREREKVTVTSSHSDSHNGTRGRSQPQSQITDTETEKDKHPLTGVEGGRGTARAAPALVLHDSLPTADWDDWLTHRRTRRWPMSVMALQKQLNVLKAFDRDTQAQIIGNSIQAGWQGIFPPKGNGVTKPAAPARTWRPPPDPEETPDASR